jgi:hypothetical protein
MWPRFTVMLRWLSTFERPKDLQRSFTTIPCDKLECSLDCMSLFSLICSKNQKRSLTGRNEQKVLSKSEIQFSIFQLLQRKIFWFSFAYRILRIDLMFQSRFCLVFKGSRRKSIFSWFPKIRHSCQLVSFVTTLLSLFVNWCTLSI